MKIDTLILSGGGPSGVAYFGIFKALFEKNIINKNLDGIKEVITTSVGIIPSIFFILRLPLEVGLRIIMNYNLNTLTDTDLITIDSILVDFGLFNNQGVSDLIGSILKNHLKKETSNHKKLKSTVLVGHTCQGCNSLKIKKETNTLSAGHLLLF